MGGRRGIFVRFVLIRCWNGKSGVGVGGQGRVRERRGGRGERGDIAERMEEDEEKE